MIIRIAGLALATLMMASTTTTHLVRQGEWQITVASNINGKTLSTTHAICIDPNHDFDTWLHGGSLGFGTGCSWPRATRSGNTYRTSEICSGSVKGYKRVQFTALSDSAYTMDTQEALSGSADTVHTTARRTGDCG